MFLIIVVILLLYFMRFVRQQSTEHMFIYIYGDFSFVAVCILKRSVLGVTSRPDRDGRGFARPNQQMPKLRHANTMPTHANKMDKTGGTPCLVHSTSICWHSAGIPQLGHLRLRRSVLTIQGVNKY